MHGIIGQFDHLGFGFSDKPTDNFVYSMADHAENALDLLRQLGIRRAHVVAHDMGDSVLTEILARRQRGLLPDYFDDFFKSVTFTNGGMRYDLIQFRLSQRLLQIPYVGEFLASDVASRLPESVLRKINQQQLSEIWGNGDEAMKQEDMANIFEINRYKGGNKLFHKTVSYLSDRKRFEPRWLASLSKLDIPCMLLWGDSDAVSPTTIPKSLAMDFLPHHLVTGKTLQGTGHFLMLERPRDWAQLIIEFIQK